MDGDLAFCLGQFVDDQVKLIDQQLEEIEKEEEIECEKIEEEKIIYEKKNPIVKINKGSHDEDEKFLNQLIDDVRQLTNENNKVRKTIIDDPVCLDTLHAEISTKVNACTNYLVRLRNLAQPLPRTKKFVETCNETIDHFRNIQELEENFQNLCKILRETNSDSVEKDVRKWWKNFYGKYVKEINQRNQKINPAITENNFSSLSPTSRIIDNAKKLLNAREIRIVQPPKIKIIQKYVKQFLIIDEQKRNEIDEEKFIEELNNKDNEEIIEYFQKWLQQRDQFRNEKEPDSFEIKIDAAKAEYGRQKIAQEAKKLALAALLCRLAVGSSNGEQFDRQLKQTINKQKEKEEENFPVVSGDIREPEINELPVNIQLENNEEKMNLWFINENNIQQRFGDALCKAFLIPENNIRVAEIEPDQGIVRLFILPPYGKDVVDCLNGNSPDSAARMQAVRQCCIDLNTNVESITLGEFSLKIEDRLMDPRWNKNYVWANNNRSEGDYWGNPIDRGGKPYFCPSGWKRFGVKVAENEAEFDARWGKWYVAYHGTRGENASKILTSGLRVSTNGCFYKDGVPRVYVSPSIEYCAHPRYAFPWKQTKKDGEVLWYQLVFQCRVNPASIRKIGIETLIPDEHKQKVKIDPNFSNNELEWIVIGQTGAQFITNDIICYGLMMRISPIDPAELESSAWWKYALHSKIYKK